MQTVVDGFISGFPSYLMGVSVAGGMVLVSGVVYVLLTPWKELTLVKNRNGAAGLALAGAIVGLAVPMAAALASSAQLLDLVLWGVVALIMQLIAYRIVDFVLRGLPKRIEEDQAGAAIVLVGAKLSVAMLLAAGLWDPNLRYSRPLEAGYGVPAGTPDTSSELRPTTD